jgi:hypothetical protein
MHANPQAQAHTAASRIQSVECGPRGATSTGVENGRAIRSTACEAGNVLTDAGTGTTGMWLPALINNANGSRNFKDALNHSQ